jgi:hypothetical protein
MSQQKEQLGLEKAVTKQIGNFLFEKPTADESGEFLDIRTDVNTKSMFSALLYYRVLGSYFKCKAATQIANILERLSISTNREGRREAVISLLQKLPSPKYLPSGMDELMQKYQSGEFLSGESSDRSES